MLYNNLERQGVDLAIEANVLYVDVTNRRVGANTSTPNADLQVVGTANIADITISSNAISSSTGAINFGSNANITISGGEIGRVLTSDGYGSVTWELVSTLATGFGNVSITNNTITSTVQDSNLELTANGTGVVTTLTYDFYAANVYTANVTAGFINGNVRANDIIATGNITAPWFVGNLDGTVANLSGNVTAPYFVGNVEGNVNGNVTAVTVDASGNITAPWFVGNLDGTTVTTTGNITAPYFIGNVEGNVAGNLVGNVTATTITSGNVTADFFNGNIRANDIISTGNITAPWFLGNVEGTTVTTTGNITGPYFIGNVEGNVNGNVTAVTVDATGNVTAPWFVGNVDSTTVTATGNITAPYFIGNLQGNVEGNVSATSVVATGNIDAGFFNGNLRANDIITGNVISGDSYISSTEVKLQDVAVAGNVISSLTTDLVFSANLTDPNNIVRFDSVSAIDIASGTTAQRPPNPDPGYVRYNTDITTIEWWNGTEWTAGSRLIEAETITPDGINQTFTLGQSTLPEGILVNINGTIQQAMSGAYTVAGDQITFSEIPEITDIIEIRYLSAGMTSASWYGGTIVNPVHITAMTPTTSATTGALTVHGGVGFGSNLTIAGNIIPAANTAYSLGDADHWWKSLYVSSNTIYINGIPLSVQADGTLLVNNAPVSASGSTYANSNVAAYLTSQDITGANIGTLFNNNASTQANLGAFQTYANANVGVLYNGNIATNANLGAYQTYANLSIDELQANLGSTQTWANANIASINANVGSFYTWANTNFGTSSYSNTNTAAYLVANPQSGTYSNTNVAAYLTTQTFYSNINVDAYIGANIGTLYNGNASTNANLGAFQTWANANAAGLSNQITGANAVVSMLQANVGSFYTWANTNFGTSSYSNANVSAYLVANPQGSTYSNTNVAAYLVANPQGSTYSNTNVEAYIGANIGAYQTYANANAATQATSINTINANVGAYQIYANANIGTLFNGNISTNANLGAFQLYANANIGTLYNGNISTNANLGAFQTYANANIGVLFNGNISTNANLGAYQVWANANAVTQQTSITSLATNANTNTAAYLAAGISTNVTTTGNVSATNVIVNGQPTTYGVVNPDYINAGRITSDQTGAGSGSDIIFNYAPVSSGISLNTSTGVFTLAAGKTYQLFAELSFSNFSDTANGYEIYDWVDATTNTRLVTTGIGAGIGENINRNTNEFNATSTTLIYTPTTNQTVKVRIVEATGTVTVRAGIGTKAIIQQINPTIAVQATATGTVNNQYSGVTLTSNQVIGSPGTPTNIVFQSATGTVPYNTSTGVWTLTSGVTYNLTAVLAVTGASNYLGYQWVDSVSGTALSTALGFATLATTQVSSVPLSIVYTPNTNQTIVLRNVNGQYASVIANYSWATVTQINQAFALNALATMTLTGALTASGDVTGQNLISTNASGNEGGEIDLAKSPNSSLSGSQVIIDQYIDRIRFFEAGGTTRGAYIDLSQASAGVDTLLNNRVSAFVNAGTFVTMDNIKATVTTSGQRGLSLATVSGTASCYIGGTYGGSSVGSGGTSAGFSMTTTASSSIFGWSFPTEGDTATYILNYTYTKSYRITIQIGYSYNNNMITIERLI